MNKIMPRSKEEIDAEFEGRYAMRRGMSWKDNPYRENTALHIAWEEGYSKELDQYRDTW